MAGNAATFRKITAPVSAVATNTTQLQDAESKLQKQIASNATAPGTLNEVTPFADKFIQRYLALADANVIGSSNASNSTLASSALVALSILS